MFELCTTIKYLLSVRKACGCHFASRGHMIWARPQNDWKSKALYSLRHSIIYIRQKKFCTPRSFRSFIIESTHEINMVHVVYRCSKKSFSNSLVKSKWTLMKNRQNCQYLEGHGVITQKWQASSYYSWKNEWKKTGLSNTIREHYLCVGHQQALVHKRTKWKVKINLPSCLNEGLLQAYSPSCTYQQHTSSRSYADILEIHLGLSYWSAGIFYGC